MKIPCCSVCQTRYDDEERVPLLLQCGHGFCKDCLSRMFSASPDTTLSCPRCRHLTVVGNSVQGLRKNYAILALIHSSSTSAANNFDCDFTDDEDNEDEDDYDRDDEVDVRVRGGPRASCSSEGGGVIEMGTHNELKLVKRIGKEGKRVGEEMWIGVLSRGGGRCKHKVAVKKVVIGEEEERDFVWVQNQLDALQRKSMWCRNVCVFHGSMRMDGCLCLVMDRCYGSIKSEMQRNEGRLTLKQILRSFLHYMCYNSYLLSEFQLI